jgi:transcriptional regulator GlxA family with amidase domain
LQLLDQYLSGNAHVTGFLSALRDRHVSKALMLIHGEPGFAWSLSSVGERAGMYPATLVRHFQDAVGVAPMTYIRNWRIMKAYSAIGYTTGPLVRITLSMGFASSKTLARAFDRDDGYTPNKLRHTHLD